MNDEQTPTYYTVAPCGCVKLISVDIPSLAKDNARELAKALRRGETVHRCTVKDVRDGTIALGWCKQCRPRRKRKAPASAQMEMLL